MKIIKSEISQLNIHSTKIKTNFGQNNTCEVQIFTENFRPTFTSLLLFLPALQLLAILDIFRVNSILAVETKNGKARKLVLAVRIEASAILEVLEDFVNDGESLGKNKAPVLFIHFCIHYHKMAEFRASFVWRWFIIIFLVKETAICGKFSVFR